MFSLPCVNLLYTSHILVWEVVLWSLLSPGPCFVWRPLRALKGSSLVFPDERGSWQKNGERQGSCWEALGHPISDKDSPSSTSFPVLEEWLQKMRSRTCASTWRKFFSSMTAFKKGWNIISAFLTKETVGAAHVCLLLAICIFLRTCPVLQGFIRFQELDIPSFPYSYKWPN